MTTTIQTLATAAPTRTTELRRAGRRQGLAVSGQLLAGVGNLLVSALLARLLLPSGYATFVAFLAGYVLLHTVGSSVTSSVALDPSLASRLRRRALLVGVGVAGALAAASPALAPALGLPIAAVLLLALAAPSATLLALARGRLYGTEMVSGTVATLVAEPVVRGLLALALVPLWGTTGAALAVVLAGYGALLTATLAARRRPSLAALSPAPQARFSAVTLTFLLVAVIAAQDVIIANRILPGDQAGLIAAVATLGGAAYFATATIPMVLLPSSRQSRRGEPLLVALAAAVGISLSVVAVVALLPAEVYVSAIGEAYRGVDRFAVAYVAAMAALGTARVLLAELCAVGRARLAGLLVGLAVALQLGLLLNAATAGDVVGATAISCISLLVATSVATAVTRHTTVTRHDISRPPHPTARRASAPAAAATAEWSWDVSPDLAAADDRKVDDDGPTPSWRERAVPLWPLGLALVVGLVLRVIVTRSIWVDEAISIQQSQLAFSDLIVTLRENDVHPPLFGALLWAVVHVTGSTAEWVVRLPSMVAGMIFIPVMYAMARDLWDRRTARIAAFVAAIAPIAVWYSQEARMYAIWMLLATVAAWTQIRILRGSEGGVSAERGRAAGRGLDWALFCVSSVAMLYLQWFTLLPLLVQHAIFAISAFRRRDRGLARVWATSVVASLALFAPLVPYLAAQSASVIEATSANGAPAQTGAAASEVSSADPDIYAIAANTIWTLWGYHADDTMVQLSALWPLALLACFAALGRRRTRYDAVLVLVAVVPAALLFLIGFERRQFFELRYFTSTVPMLLLLLSRLAASWGRGPVTSLVLPGLVMASLAGGLVDQQVNQSNPRNYDFRGAVTWVKANAEPGDVMLYAPSFLNSELAYYSAGIPTLAAKSVRPRAAKTGMPPVPPDGRSVFVFGSFLNERPTAAEVGKTLYDLRAAGATEVGLRRVANVTVWEFKEMPR